ncbi:T32E20.15 [Arabidopsis thaliana]|uniref:T32E20.15 n=1 Tax=Arabidopsis thaliana TaxID=3702 RepID=Q9LPA5_ARATH|nr:T32E20.15 [Arabidopsis thaliana]
MASSSRDNIDVAFEEAFVNIFEQMGQSTSMKCMEHFGEAIMFLFEDEYLRKPSAQDRHRLLILREIQGFSGMMGSTDCMHWEWKNCPTS